MTRTQAINRALRIHAKRLRPEFRGSTVRTGRIKAVRGWFGWKAWIEPVS